MTAVDTISCIQKGYWTSPFRRPYDIIVIVEAGEESGESEMMDMGMTRSAKVSEDYKFNQAVHLVQTEEAG